MKKDIVELHAFLAAPSVKRTWLAVLILITITIPLTVNLVLSRQDISPRAQELPSTNYLPTLTPTPILNEGNRIQGSSTDVVD